MKILNLIKYILLFTVCLFLLVNVACKPAGGDSVASAQEQLDQMDTRRPVPLIPMMANHQKENMRDHLLVIQEILQALAVKDFEAIEKSASRISYSEKQEQMCSHMGAGAEGFSELGVDFHRTAATIIEAAKNKDGEATLKAVSHTLVRCTSCHSQYRQQIVGEKEWQALTGKEMKGSGSSR